MNRSFFTATKESVFVAGSDNFASGIQTGFAALGLTSAQSTAYQAVNTTLQSAYLTAITPATRTKSAVAAKNLAVFNARRMASDLAKIINGNPTVSDQQKIDLGIAVQGIPKPRPAPGTPNRFAVSLASNGALTLTWKCNNPPGSSGTIYQVFRRTGAAGQYEFVGGTGEKKFVDSTIPAGTATATYQIQAVRSTMGGPWAEFNVNFGVAGQQAAVEEVSPVRMAA